MCIKKRSNQRGDSPQNSYILYHRNYAFSFYIRLQVIKFRKQTKQHSLRDNGLERLKRIPIAAIKQGTN